MRARGEGVCIARQCACGDGMQGCVYRGDLEIWRVVDCWRKGVDRTTPSKDIVEFRCLRLRRAHGGIDLVGACDQRGVQSTPTSYFSYMRLSDSPDRHGSAIGV